ncbi:hypothetical protein LNP74_29620 [Klebsiella pneumoniae subsp. pneumoniae]|nr:hypothetical protein [Klebsiella pneumoniae subsp. pneumoniae]
MGDMSHVQWPCPTPRSSRHASGCIKTTASDTPSGKGQLLRHRLARRRRRPDDSGRWLAAHRRESPDDYSAALE